MSTQEAQTEQKIQKLQLLEQNMQSILVQRQQFQGQLIEVKSALIELDKSEDSYRIIGNIMVNSGKEDIKKDLNDKKEILELRIKNLEKQENSIKDKSKSIQEEVLGNIQKSD